MMLLLLSSAVHAQQQCVWRPEGPRGPAWYQPGGWGDCDNNASQQPTTPPIRWASRWGAVAIDHRTANIGTITAQATEKDAKRIALERCESEGNKNCKIEATYANQCVAIAWGTRYSSTKDGPTIEQASERALRTCEKGKKEGGDEDSCKIILAECSLPERIQ